jgi:hypothetical protein
LAKKPAIAEELFDWSPCTVHVRRNTTRDRLLFSLLFSLQKYRALKRSVATGSLNGEGLTQWRGRIMKTIITSAIVALAAVTAANAADMPLKAIKAPPPMPSWWNTLTITGLVEVGGSANANNPAVTNFGQLFTDKAPIQVS